MARGDNPLHDHPRSKKASEEKREAKKGDVEKFDGEEFESIGEKWLTGKKFKGPGGTDLEGIGSDVDEDELKGTATIDPKTGKRKMEGKGWDEIRTKDSEGGRRREYFKRKPAVPTS
jgi:hypothetical protein